MFNSKWCPLIIGNIKENEEESFEIPQKSGKSGHANTPRPKILPTGLRGYVRSEAKLNKVLKILPRVKQSLGFGICVVWQ